jgi:hypothetical protein
MKPLWMGVVPAPEYVRVLLLDDGGTALLKARLPQDPRHPRALESLCEALALWCGRPIRAAVAADRPGAWCATKPWLDTFDAITRSPLCQIDFVASARPPKRSDGLEGMGDFHDVRQLVLFGGRR